MVKYFKFSVKKHSLYSKCLNYVSSLNSSETTEFQKRRYLFELPRAHNKKIITHYNAKHVVQRKVFFLLNDEKARNIINACKFAAIFKIERIKVLN